MENITLYVQEPSGEQTLIEAPLDMGMNLMEILKAHEYPIEAICGGMALCATCHIEILKGEIGKRTDAEVDMLDTLFNTTAQSRLACQIRIHEGLQDTILKLKGEDG